jgi:hypothetical protein
MASLENLGVTDMDEDGDHDVLLPRNGYVIRNESVALHPASAASLYTGLDLPGGTVSLAVADVNGDGRDDLIATDADAPARASAGMRAIATGSVPLFRSAPPASFPRA